MEGESYYDCLYLSRDASEEDIRKAYKKMAFLYHPDRAGPVGEETFKKISEAYSVLSDSKKKEEYDFSLQGGDFEWEDFFRGFDKSDFEGVNLKEMIFEKTIPAINVMLQNHLNNMKEMNCETSVEKVGKNKPDDTIITIRCSLKEVYRMKERKVFIPRKRLDKNGERVEKIKKVMVSLTKREHVIKGAGDELQGYRKRGDVRIYVHIESDESFYRVGENIYTFFEKGKTTPLILPHGKKVKINKEESSRGGSFIKKENMGLPYSLTNGEITRGDLWILIREEGATGGMEVFGELSKNVG